MYSKYLDYTEAAVRANFAAQAENDQKDIIINSLKNEVFQLKRIELDYQKLNALIFELGEKYELLHQDKDRAEKEQRYSTSYKGSRVISTKTPSSTFAKKSTFLRSISKRLASILKNSSGKTLLRSE
jgi:hypothetical protein